MQIRPNKAVTKLLMPSRFYSLHLRFTPLVRFLSGLTHADTAIHRQTIVLVGLGLLHGDTHGTRSRDGNPGAWWAFCASGRVCSSCLVADVANPHRRIRSERGRNGPGEAPMPDALHGVWFQFLTRYQYGRCDRVFGASQCTMRHWCRKKK